tara:strand:+ start:962 stop:1744 length:783 start_codon:yes stop_codon:yes gene_type:complete
MKRGQVTLFIIIGILLVIVIGLFLHYKGTLSDIREFSIGTEIVLSQEAQEIYDLVDECMGETTETSFIFLGQQGGYYEVPDKYYDTGFSQIPYFLYEGARMNNQDISVFEEEFNKQFGFDFIYCVALIAESDETIEVTYEDYDSEIKIIEGEIVINVELPISIELNNGTYEFSEFQYYENTNIYKILELKDQILELNEEKLNYVPLSSLMDLLTETDIGLELNRDGEEVLYILTDSNFSKNGLPYDFQFLIKYEWIENEE